MTDRVFKKTRTLARNAAVSGKPGGKRTSTTKVTVAKVKKPKPKNTVAANSQRAPAAGKKKQKRGYA